MSSFSRWMVAVGGLVTLTGLGLFLTRQSVEMAPPRLPPTQNHSHSPHGEPFPEIAALVGPWYHHVSIPPQNALAPSLPPQVQTDKVSVVFIGSYSEQDGTMAYFFKDKRTSQSLILKFGQTVKGWTLDSMTANSFTLIGPGGRYEVPH